MRNKFGVGQDGNWIGLSLEISTEPSQVAFTFLQQRGGPRRMAALAATVDALNLPNPFIVASGPSGTNLNVITKAFQGGARVWLAL